MQPVGDNAHEGLTHAYRYPDQRSHPPPPPPSHPRQGSHRSTSPEGSRQGADYDPRDARGRSDYLERRVPNGDMPPNYRGSRHPRDGPNGQARQQYNPPHDGNHASAYQTARQLDQLSISTSQAPKVSYAQTVTLQFACVHRCAAPNTMHWL